MAVFNFAAKTVASLFVVCGYGRMAPSMKYSDIPEDKKQDLFKMAAERMGTNSERLQQAAQNGEIDKMISGLDEKQAQQLQKILNDPKAAERMLSTPQAQMLFKKFFGNQ